jgi:lactate dehydrogenase-like 2-hydroxyacid dehydrogenase
MSLLAQQRDSDHELAAAALDVFATELNRIEQSPRHATCGSWIMWFLRPHVSSNTDAANRRMAEACVANIHAYYAGDLDKMTIVPELSELKRPSMIT